MEKYEVEFIDLLIETSQFDPLMSTVNATSNADARKVFKREMNSKFGMIENKDYKIEHVTIYNLDKR